MQTRRSILAFAVMLVAVVGLAGCFGKKLSFGKGEVYYKDPVTEAEATKLGNFLKTEQYFDDTTQKSVQLLKENDVFIVKFVVIEGAEKQEDAVNAFGIFAKQISKDVFGGGKVQVELTDSNLKTVKSIPLAAASN